MDKEPARAEVQSELVRLARGRGLSAERLAGSRLLAVRWVEQEVDRTGETPERLCFLFLRHLISEYEGGFGPRCHALRAAFNLHPDASSPKLGRRREDVASMMGLSGRTIARYVSDGQTAIAIAFMEEPSAQLLDKLRTNVPEPGKIHVHVRTFRGTLSFDDEVRQSRVRLEYLFVSRVPNLKRTRITSGYERADTLETVGAPISYIEGAQLLEEFRIPNGSMVHRIEFPKELFPGDEQLVIVERDLRGIGPLKKQWGLGSGTPVDSVSMRLNFSPEHSPGRAWGYEDVEHFTAPTPYSDDARLQIDRFGMAEFNTKISNPAFVCGVAWE